MFDASECVMFRPDLEPAVAKPTDNLTETPTKRSRANKSSSDGESGNAINPYQSVQEATLRNPLTTSITDAINDFNHGRANTKVRLPDGTLVDWQAAIEWQSGYYTTAEAIAWTERQDEFDGRRCRLLIIVPSLLGAGIGLYALLLALPGQ
jgi:hypothetical protein